MQVTHVLMLQSGARFSRAVRLTVELTGRCWGLSIERWRVQADFILCFCEDGGVLGSSDGSRNSQRLSKCTAP